ncbi:hypothetical protein EVAR_32187_1 [Eumeta japonica]|uniref:Uncharacterized protein n=1 Tax=Eumeta variegata TaxID=151549 RepID=A0A4C1VXS1_EUMVA|nr:hypothetical protein EVAR_32187_1 [Eumeta japonica]
MHGPDVIIRKLNTPVLDVLIAQHTQRNAHGPRTRTAGAQLAHPSKIIQLVMDVTPPHPAPEHGSAIENGFKYGKTATPRSELEYRPGFGIITERGDSKGEGESEC